MSESSSRSMSPNPAVDRPYVATRRHRTNADYGDVLVTQFQSSNLFSVDVYKWTDDDLSFRNAAAQSRLPYDHLSPLELRFFSDTVSDHVTTLLYLFCRNKTLVLWHLDPLVELTLPDVLKEIPSPYNGNIRLIQNIHAFLQRYGYINYGVFLNFSKMVLSTRLKVIVIGAGVAGLTAARQLKFFGFDVKILEGRSRTGGRVFSYHMAGNSADLGAQIITGINGNPIITLARQVSINLIRVTQRCPIFDSNGKMVNYNKDVLIQTSFNKILEACAFIAHDLKVKEIGGQRLSLGRAFDAILNQEEFRVLEKRLNYFKKYREIANTLRDLNKKLLLQRMTVESCMKELAKMVDMNTTNYDDIYISYNKIENKHIYEHALKLRLLRSSLLSAVETYEDTEKQRKELDRVFAEFKNMEPSQVYMNTSDKRILDFHLANLEYGIGSPINTASLEHWDHDDDFGFDGSHVMVSQGYHELIHHLARDLDLQLESVVKHVKYGENGVDVTYSQKRKGNAENAELDTEHADAVLCTVPLGVLKASMVQSALDSTICFEPPLPKWKRKAIVNLGYGSLNKIVLKFETVFWDSTLHTFGRLNEANVARGEMFMFFTNGVTPILTGLLAGDSASSIDDKREEYLVIKAMNILQSIFGNACPKHPLTHAVTLWHSDPFSLGCYSYVSTNSKSEDYDTLAKPVIDSGENNTGMAHLFFAGEHTNREYTANVHGAFLSGIRAAAEIADTFIGPALS